LTAEPPVPDSLKDFVPYFLPETAEPTVMNPFGLIAPKVDVVSLEKLMPELTADEPEMYLGSDPIPAAENNIQFFGLESDKLPSDCPLVSCTIDGPHEHTIEGPASTQLDVDITILNIKDLLAE